jgi:hypothetical protein
VPKQQDEKRRIPPVLADDLEQFLFAVEAWRRKAQKKKRAGHGPGSPGFTRFQNLPPPWVRAESFSDPEDDAVIAWVAAVHMIRPSESVKREEPWLIRGLLRRAEAGPPLLSRLSVEHFPDCDLEVTGTVLRGVRVADIREDAYARLKDRPIITAALRELGGRGPSPEEERWAQRVAEEARKLPLNRGRKGYPAEHYRRIALRCLKLYDDGRRDVLKELAAEEDRPYQTIRDWVRRARDPELGFLAPGRQGRIDFRPGPNLYRKEK